MKENIPDKSALHCDFGDDGLTDLRLDVTPFAGSLELDQQVVELLSHGNDPVGHLLDFAKPTTLARADKHRVNQLTIADTSRECRE